MTSKNSMPRRVVLVALLGMVVSLLPFAAAGASGDHPAVTPEEVVATVAVGGSFEVQKTAHTPEIPPMVEVCLLQDETGSFWDDIDFLQAGTTAEDIYDTVVAASPGARFAVAGFRDYDVEPYGSPGDWVYRLLSGMDNTKANWLAGVAGLLASGGNDTPEAQYDAIVAAAQGGFDQEPCGFDPDPLVTRVLVVTTDAPFHGPDGTHINDLASTTAVLTGSAPIVVIGLTAPGSGGELGLLAAATGGTTQPLSSDGANIGAAIVAGLSNLPVDVSMASNCGGPIFTAFDPGIQTVTSGDDAFFTETIWVAGDSPPGTYECEDWAMVNGEQMADEAGALIYEYKMITAAAAFCTEGVNPAGKTPQAPGTGQNEDGFFLIGADPEGLLVEVVDSGSGTVFGPFPTGTNIKYTQNDDEISIRPGPGAVDWKIKGYGDAWVTFTDAFGNTSAAACLVPAPPK